MQGLRILFRYFPEASRKLSGNSLDALRRLSGGSRKAFGLLSGGFREAFGSVSYTHLRAHETSAHL
eukprot:6963235-Alexandrium_andersonii.AAC.1